MRSTSQGRLAQARCTRTLHPGRTYVLGSANERSSLAVLVCKFPRVSITGNKYGTKKRSHQTTASRRRYHAKNGQLRMEHLHKRHRELDGSTKPPTLGWLAAQWWDHLHDHRRARVRACRRQWLHERTR